MATRLQSLIWVLLIFLVSANSAVIAAEPQQDLNEQTRLIRIKKIASEWQGAILTLHTSEGEEIKGRLVEVSNNIYHLEIDDKAVEIPLKKVIKVSFDPGFPEIMLTFASAAMGSGFMGGAMMLSKTDASSSDISIASFIGLLGGGLWGYTTFYESEVILLE